MDILLFVLLAGMIYCLYVVVFLGLSAKSLHTNVGNKLNNEISVVRDDWSKYNDYIRSFPGIPSTIVGNLTISDKELDDLYGK